MNTTTNTVPFNFSGIPLAAIEHEEDLWLTGEDIGNALEYTNPRIAINKLYKRNQAELDQHSIVVKMPVAYGDAYPREGDGGNEEGTCVTSLGTHVGSNYLETPPAYPEKGAGATRLQPVRVFNEEGVMILTMLSSQPKAAEFRAWGGKALTALGGKFGLAGGLATGKALESAAGVTPVYVVNMPGGGINGGGLDIPAGLGKDALVKGASAANKFKVGAALLGGMNLSAIPSLGAGAMASAGLAVGAAGAAGYGVGTGIYKYGLEGNAGGEAIGAAIAKAFSLFNIGDSRMAVEINEKLKNTEIGGKISLEVTDKRVAVTAMKPSNPNVKMNVDAGHTMTGA